VSTANRSSRIHKLSISLHSTDRLLIAFWCLLSLVGLFFHSRIQGWQIIIAANLAATALACALAYTAGSADSRVPPLRARLGRISNGRIHLQADLLHDRTYPLPQGFRSASDMD